jgi:hypothetical protein
MQVFFISPDGYIPIRTALAGISGQSTHGWMDTDAGATQIIGVAEIRGNGNGEQVASALEAAGITVLPDHRFGETFANHPNVVTALAPYGVTATDTTATATAKVLTKSGFPPHKVKRFQ